jgi:serine/threonine-protein kinase
MLPRRATGSLRLGPYTLLETIARGGMATVHKARRQGPTAKIVVVQAMLPSLAENAERVELFFAEARLSAQLEHPNIAQVIDFGVDDGTPFLVMELLDGLTVAEVAQRLAARGRRRFPVGAALTIARDVGHALAYAHNFVDAEGERRQIIHRDVSPSNIMLCRDGTVKLLDFGVARVVAEKEAEPTRSFRGKYAYLAPEQVLRQPYDRRVDVFAAGIVLHEMLTGKRLFASVSELETLERVAAAQVTAPSGENPEVPRSLDAVVKRALAKDPSRRFTSGGALADALDQFGALLFSRSQLSTFLRNAYESDETTVTCEVCGKQVAVGAECHECGARPEPAAPPPRLFVVPKLPSPPPSAKLAPRERPRLRPVEALPPPVVVRPRPSFTVVAPAPRVEAPPRHLDEPAPDLRSEGRGVRVALALLAIGLIGLCVTLSWGSTPPRATVAAPERPLPKTILPEPVIVHASVPKPIAAVAPKPPAAPRPRRRARAAAPPSPTVKEGRLVNPFAGDD